jgi:hypothetical protein
MPNIKTLDIQTIIKDNPQVSAESLRRVEMLVDRLNRLGIVKTDYRLASPFSLSLRKIHKANPTNRLHQYR